MILSEYVLSIGNGDSAGCERSDWLLVRMLPRPCVVGVMAKASLFLAVILDMSRPRSVWFEDEGNRLFVLGTFSSCAANSSLGVSEGTVLRTSGRVVGESSTSLRGLYGGASGVWGGDLYTSPSFSGFQRVEETDVSIGKRS